MRAAFHTLGCKVNQYETQAMTESFAAAGFEIVSFDSPAEAYVINTCAVTSESARKSRQFVRRARALNPGAVIAAVGCLTQTNGGDADGSADILIGTDGKMELCRLVLEAIESKISADCRPKPAVEIRPAPSGGAMESMKITAFSERHRANVKVEDGCRNFCAYCVIPYARGSVRSKPVSDALDEIRALAAKGYGEIVLTGIHLSSYGSDRGEDLTELIRGACAIPELRRLRLGSLEPASITPEFIGRIAGLGKLCPHFHLPLQSGDDAVLRRMGRRYDSAGFAAAARGLRGAFPDACITTDIMVAFPGETDEEFETSLGFAREMGFLHSHVFIYSKRAGTAAASMPGAVCRRTAAERSRRMISMSEDCTRECMESFKGRIFPVLLETRNPDGSLEGYAPNYLSVRLSAAQGGPYQPGDTANILLTGVSGGKCNGVAIREEYSETTQK